MTTPTTRTHPRTLAQAFPRDHAGSIETPRGHVIGFGGSMKPDPRRCRPLTPWRYFVGMFRIYRTAGHSIFRAARIAFRDATARVPF